MSASVQHPLSPRHVCLIRAFRQQRAHDLYSLDRRHRARCGQQQVRAVARVGPGLDTRHMSAEASRPAEVLEDVSAFGVPVSPTKVGA
jgi:hypothetical protein